MLVSWNFDEVRKSASLERLLHDLTDASENHAKYVSIHPEVTL